jgi:hypothetical protein
MSAPTTPNPRIDPEFDSQLELQLRRLRMPPRPLKAPPHQGRKRAQPRNRKDESTPPKGFESLGGEARSEQFLSPLHMRYHPHGQLTPGYEGKLLSLREIDTRRKISNEQARYYEETQMETDKLTSEHLHDLDGVLRADAAARSDPLAPDPSPWKLEGYLGKGGQGNVTKWTRQKPGSNVSNHHTWRNLITAPADERKDHRAPGSEGCETTCRL